MKGYSNKAPKSGKRSTSTPAGAVQRGQNKVAGSPRRVASPSKTGTKQGYGGGLPQRPGGGQAAGHAKAAKGKNMVGAKSPNAMRG